MGLASSLRQRGVFAVLTSHSGLKRVDSERVSTYGIDRPGSEWQHCRSVTSTRRRGKSTSMWSGAASSMAWPTPAQRGIRISCCSSWSRSDTCSHPALAARSRAVAAPHLRPMPSELRRSPNASRALLAAPRPSICLPEILDARYADAPVCASFSVGVACAACACRGSRCCGGCCGGGGGGSRAAEAPPRARRGRGNKHDARGDPHHQHQQRPCISHGRDAGVSHGRGRACARAAAGMACAARLKAGDGHWPLLWPISSTLLTGLRRDSCAAHRPSLHSPVMLLDARMIYFLCAIARSLRLSNGANISCQWRVQIWPGSGVVFGYCQPWMFAVSDAVRWRCPSSRTAKRRTGSYPRRSGHGRGGAAARFPPAANG